jgi:hemerythrin-like domain-containing protein
MINDLEGRIAGAASDPAELTRAMEEVLSFVIKELEPHAGWEERVMYALVDRLTGGYYPPVTATLRYEHAVMGRWLRKFEASMSAPLKHPAHGIILASELFGLIRAHLEVEEEVLFPILDAKAKAADLRPPPELTSPHPTAADTSLPAPATKP